MNSYWVLVRTVPGSFIRVIIQSDTPYNAYQMAKAMYGDQLLSASAAYVV